MRIELQPAYFLHSRNYSDTSIIADFWTPNFGRLSVLAKGARRRKGGNKHLLIPFTPLLISCQGRSELKTLTHIELAGAARYLQGSSLFSGYYLNELLLRLLPVADPHPQLFSCYCGVVESLASVDFLEPCLREFEWSLLRELGYGLDFSVDAVSHSAVIAESLYQLDCERGFFQATQGPFTGADLLAIAGQDYSMACTARAAKLIARRALRQLLGDKPLNSREMFRQMQL